MFQNVDPAHHLRGTAAYLLEQRHADYALSAKGNQAAPLAWVHAALPPAVPEAEEHVQTERSRGRIIRSSAWTAPLPDQLTLTPPTLGAPGRIPRFGYSFGTADGEVERAAGSVAFKSADRIDSPNGPSVRCPLSPACKIS